MTVTINGSRLWQDLMDTARIGATPAGGLNRLALSDQDCEVRDWFSAACRDNGCLVTVDDMGNIFARRAGGDGVRAPIMIGSHLDTQPMGGRFDGILGVLGALEVVRALDDADVSTRHPIEIVNWTNEEGARFAPAMLSSGVFAGVFERDDMYRRVDQNGIALGDELARINYRGNEPCGDHSLAAYVELHIEQGPILEAASDTIGVVTGVQGARWYDLTISGSSGHAGATPMRLRRDAMVGAARIVHALHMLALGTDDRAAATVGVVEAMPGSRNVVPGAARVTIDLRHPDADVLNAMDVAARDRVEAICYELGLESVFECVWDSAPTAFDARCIAAVREAADAAGLSHQDIVSGAGHDAVYVSKVAPTGMVFVPCKDGISHNEAESIEPDHAAAGAQALANAVLLLDERID